MKTEDAWTELRRHWEECAKDDVNHATPAEREILDRMRIDYHRLEKLGWKPAVYCPKDGSTFLAITAGSSWASPCQYHGEWPMGAWLLLEAGDMWPCYPILWKPLQQKEKK